MDDDINYSDKRISNMIRNAFDLFVSGFNKFIILSPPIALASLFFIYYSNTFYTPSYLQLEDKSAQFIITFLIITIIYLIISILFTAALFNSAYSVSTSYPGKSILESIKKGVKRFFPLFGLTLLIGIIATGWMLLTVFLPLIFAIAPLAKSVTDLNSLCNFIFTPTTITAILLILGGVITFILIFGVPFYLYAEPEICIKEKCRVFEAFGRSFIKTKGMRIKGFVYLIIIFLIQLAFCALLFSSAYLITSFLTLSKGISLKEILSQGEEFIKLNYIFNITSTLASLVTTPFHISAITVFYRTIENEEEKSTP